jgi:hypothetical protein
MVKLYLPNTIKLKSNKHEIFGISPEPIAVEYNMYGDLPVPSTAITYKDNKNKIISSNGGYLNTDSIICKLNTTMYWKNTMAMESGHNSDNLTNFGEMYVDMICDRLFSHPKTRAPLANEESFISDTTIPLEIATGIMEQLNTEKVRVSLTKQLMSVQPQRFRNIDDSTNEINLDIRAGDEIAVTINVKGTIKPKCSDSGTAFDSTTPCPSIVNSDVVDGLSINAFNVRLNLTLV